MFDKIAVVGAGTEAGSEIIGLIDERGFPCKEILPLDDSASPETSVHFRGEDLQVYPVEANSFGGCDLAFFAAGESVSARFVPEAMRQGCMVIDASEYSRRDPKVPLVIPEVNPEAIAGHSGIIASPSPSTINMALALMPLHQAASITRIIASTSQSVSAHGKKGMDELADQIKALLTFKEPEVREFPYRVAFNVIPQSGEFSENGYTRAEMGTADDIKRLFGDDKIRICLTSVIVPVLYGDFASINIETKKKMDPDGVRRVLRNAPGVKVEDDPSRGLYPMASEAVGMDECFVGRIREDLSARNGIAMWVVSDNIRRGIVLNAVEIAEHLVQGLSAPGQ
ncbi:MAG: aspartate-semialdehyde dehydrogenase [Thermodesulfobacteriota bacterium]|nr:aspartate-semialdehyde dehydrogenase [Thermodesulfobacteriota bacterium]